MADAKKFQAEEVPEEAPELPMVGSENIQIDQNLDVQMVAPISWVELMRNSR